MNPPCPLAFLGLGIADLAVCTSKSEDFFWSCSYGVLRSGLASGKLEVFFQSCRPGYGARGWGMKVCTVWDCWAGFKGVLWVVARVLSGLSRISLASRVRLLALWALAWSSWER